MGIDYCFLVTGTAPWVLRVDEIKSMAAVNVDAERKIVQLNEEMQELVRGIKNRVSGDGPMFRYNKPQFDGCVGSNHQRGRRQDPAYGTPCRRIKTTGRCTE